MVALDEDTGAELGRAPTGNYPDGLAYDPQHATVWTTNESGGSETIIDAATYQVRGTVNLGGEAGNVAYDPVSRMMLVDVQSHNSLAVIEPTTLTIVRQVPLPGCQHDHGLTLDPADRLPLVAPPRTAQARHQYHARCRRGSSATTIDRPACCGNEGGCNAAARA